MFEGPVTNLIVSMFQTVNTVDFPRVKLPQFSRTVTNSGDLGAVLPMRLLDDFASHERDYSDGSRENTETDNVELGDADAKQAQDVDMLRSAIDSKICDLFKKLSENL